MQIQYVSRYIALSEEGLVVKMVCPFDQGPLFPNMDNDDRVFLYCLECNYKNFLGTSIYESMVRSVKRIDKIK